MASNVASTPSTTASTPSTTSSITQSTSIATSAGIKCANRACFKYVDEFKRFCDNYCAGKCSYINCNNYAMYTSNMCTVHMCHLPVPPDPYKRSKCNVSSFESGLCSNPQADECMIHTSHKPDIFRKTCTCPAFCYESQFVKIESCITCSKPFTDSHRLLTYFCDFSCTLKCINAFCSNFALIDSKTCQKCESLKKCVTPTCSFFVDNTRIRCIFCVRKLPKTSTSSTVPKSPASSTSSTVPKSTASSTSSTVSKSTFSTSRTSKQQSRTKQPPSSTTTKYTPSITNNLSKPGDVLISQLSDDDC